MVRASSSRCSSRHSSFTPAVEIQVHDEAPSTSPVTNPDELLSIRHRRLLPHHLAALDALWPADPRIPTPASRTAWAIARGLNPARVHAWWYRRRSIAKKLKLSIPKDDYELEVGDVDEPKEGVEVEIKQEAGAGEGGLDGQSSVLPCSLGPSTVFPWASPALSATSPWADFTEILSEPAPPPPHTPPTPGPSHLDTYLLRLAQEKEDEDAYMHSLGPWLPDFDISRVPRLPRLVGASPSYFGHQAAPVEDLPPSSPPLTSASPFLSSPIGLHLNIRLDDVDNQVYDAESDSAVKEEQQEQEQKAQEEEEACSGPFSPSSSFITSFSFASAPTTSSSSLPHTPPSSPTPDLHPCLPLSPPFPRPTLPSRPGASASSSRPHPCAVAAEAVSSDVEIDVDIYTDPSFPYKLTFLQYLDPSLCSFAVSPPLECAVEVDMDVSTTFWIDGTQFHLDGSLV